MGVGVDVVGEGGEDGGVGDGSAVLGYCQVGADWRGPGIEGPGLGLGLVRRVMVGWWRGVCGI